MVEVETAHNETISVAYARFALTWAAFFTEDMRLELVPYRDIEQVRLRKRPETSPRRGVGFTAEAI